MKNRPRTSLDKALHLLQILGARGGWTGVRDLAREARYTPSSTHGLLQVLRDHGYVEFEEERRQYRLGLSVLALADTMDAGDTLGSFARPWVQRLADEVEETVMALAWRGGRARVVAAVRFRMSVSSSPDFSNPTGGSILSRTRPRFSSQTAKVGRMGAPVRSASFAIIKDVAAGMPKKSTKIPSRAVVLMSVKIPSVPRALRIFSILRVAEFLSIVRLPKRVRIWSMTRSIFGLSIRRTRKLNG